jgi:hypothetical protein
MSAAGLLPRYQARSNVAQIALLGLNLLLDFVCVFLASGKIRVHLRTVPQIVSDHRVNISERDGVVALHDLLGRGSSLEFVDDQTHVYSRLTYAQ